jgi:hypothetical protein
MWKPREAGHGEDALGGLSGANLNEAVMGFQGNLARPAATLGSARGPKRPATTPLYPITPSEARVYQLSISV